MSQPWIGERCYQCRHVRVDYSCDAFPDGMPIEIVNGFDHSQPLAGDNGIRFEPRPEGESPPVFVSLMLEEIEPSGIVDGPLA